MKVKPSDPNEKSFDVDGRTVEDHALLMIHELKNGNKRIRRKSRRKFARFKIKRAHQKLRVKVKRVKHIVFRGKKKIYEGSKLGKVMHFVASWFKYRGDVHSKIFEPQDHK